MRVRRRGRDEATTPQPAATDVAPPVPGVAVDGATATVTLRTLDDLPQVLADPLVEGRAVRLVLDVQAYRRPWKRWVGRVGSMPGLLSVAVELPEEDGPARVELGAVGSRPVHVLLVSAARLLAPDTLPPMAMSPRVVVDSPALATDPAVRWRPHPLVTGGRREDNWATAAEITLDEPSGGPGLVDTVRYSPLGRTSPVPGAPVRRADWRPGFADSVDGGKAAFETLDVLAVPAGAASLSAEQTAGLLRASACGVVVHVPTEVAVASVPDPVAAAWRRPVPPDDATELYAASVVQRRAVHRFCSAQDAFWRRLQGEGLVMGAQTAVSVLLATRRPANLPTMLRQIAAQDHPQVELVLALHGDEWDDSWVAGQIAAATAERDLPVTVLRLPTPVPLGGLLGAATLRASGTFVAKMDDDDGYEPQHLSDLVMAQRWSGAQVTGKPAEFTYLRDRDVTLRVQTITETYGSFVAGGTLLIDKAALMAAGGWRPLRSVVDRTMLRRVMDDGGLVYRTQGIGYTYVRGTGDHTFDTDEDRYLEKAIQEWPGRHVPAT